MAESGLHRFMKSVVAEDLEREEYLLFEEPLHPPSQDVSWSAYRPDIMGVRVKGNRRDFAIVECETRPNMSRFRSKNFRSLSLQSKLFQDSSLRRILVIPRGTLSRVDLRLRSDWEVWVVGEASETLKIASIPRV